MIHLQVIVADTAILLAPEAYGTGALLRWESSADYAGPYVEGGTVALVSGTSLYDVWDPAGTEATWYRTRVSNAAGTVFSPYSVLFQPSDLALYLSLDQFRALAPSTLSDDALIVLLQASQEEIIREIGPQGERTDLVSARGDLLRLPVPVLSITSVTELVGWTDTVLDPTDYELTSTRRGLRRLRSGATPAWAWRGRVRVVYAPVDDTATRQRVQAELTKLAIATNPGLISQTIGTWTEQYASNSTWNVAEERQRLLASLHDSGADLR